MTSKKLAICSWGMAAAALVCAGAASAADLPSRKAPVPVFAAPVFTWTGAYLGLSAGAINVRNKWTTTGTGLGAGILDNTANATFSNTSARLGGFLGYNWQMGSVVVGLEGDLAADFGGTKTRVGIPGTLTFFTGAVADRTSNQANWDASLRGRLGYLIMPSVLLYGTGGVAFQQNQIGISCPGVGASWCFLAESGKTSSTRTGWTLGAGLEASLASNWTARVEYRYADFGSKTTTFFANRGPAGADALTVRSKLNTQIVSVGVAYKF